MIRISIFFLLIIFKTEAQTSVLNMADSLFVNGNYSQAIAQYKLYETPSAVYDKIAKSYIAIGNYDLALEHYRACIKINPVDALLKFEYARLLSKTKNFSTASKTFQELILIDDKNPNYHYEQGLVLEKMQDSTAQTAFLEAYQLDKTHQKAIFKIAKNHLKKGRFSQVHELVNIGLESYPNNVKLISLKAQSYYWQRDYHKATEWFEKLLDLNESSQFIYEKLCMSYSKTFQYKKAIVYGEKVLNYDSENTDYLSILGRLHERIENFPEAEKYMLAFLKLQDVSLDKAYERLGMILNRQKKHINALEAFKRAVQENQESQSARFFVVFTKDQYYKDIDSRMQAYQAYMKRFPDSEFTNMITNRLSALKKEKFVKSD